MLDDLDDTHLCIKCTSSIVGLENYVRHRNSNCSNVNKSTRAVVHLQVEHPYDSTFDFTESVSTFSKNGEEVEEKANKSLTDNYELPYDLGADVFFQSLELRSSTKQRTQSTTTATVSTLTSDLNNSSIAINSNNDNCGKMVSNKVLIRSSPAISMHHSSDQVEDWIGSNTSNNSHSENLMKAVSDLSRHTNKCDTIFQLNYNQDSPDQTDDDSNDDDNDETDNANVTDGVDDENDNDEDEDEIDNEINDVNDDDEDYDNEYYEPNVPLSHTGGKWKPENPTQLFPLKNSSCWNYAKSQWCAAENKCKKKDIDEFENDLNPPPSHTKGKWVPGTKITKLIYKDEFEIENRYNQEYWCSICNRKLATKSLYERHLKSNLHKKRSEPEQQLEQAIVEIESTTENISRTLNTSNINTVNQITNSDKESISSPHSKKKRIRRKYYIKCETCNSRLPKYLFGKHLISHYHYKKMILNPSKSINVILENIHQIVQQSPFQCKSCKFYANTEEQFLIHWNSDSHFSISTQCTDKFWCSYCKFVCDTNNEMHTHLISINHKEIILTINRSVPIYIGKKSSIECKKCKMSFRYNVELRKHAQNCLLNQELEKESISSHWKYSCKICNEIFKTKRVLQTHYRNKHKHFKFFYCTTCKVEFSLKQDVVKHRNSSEHKTMASIVKNKNSMTKKCLTCGKILSDLIKLKQHIELIHPEEKCLCPYCGKSFAIAQELGRHVRDKICQLQLNVNSKTVEESILSDNAFIGEENNPLSTLNKEMKCNQCHFKSSTTAEMLFHQVLHSIPVISKQTKLTCPICCKVFRKHSLRCHLRQHTNEKIFQCNLCKIRFSRKYNLKTHMNNIHNAMKKQIVEPEISLKKLKKFDDQQEEQKQLENSHLKCNVCDKVFNKKHAKSHQCAEKRFQCSNCNFKTSISSHFKRHLRIHSGEKPYQCPYCNYFCSTSENLRKHVLTTKKHIGRSLYECQICSKDNVFHTNLQKEYRSHLMTAHNL